MPSTTPEERNSDGSGESAGTRDGDDAFVSLELVRLRQVRVTCGLPSLTLIRVGETRSGWSNDPFRCGADRRTA